MKRYVAMLCIAFSLWGYSAASMPRAVVAQDATPEVTEVIGVPPAPTAVETAQLPENPRGGLQASDLLPYAVLIIGVLILALLALGGAGFVLLYKSSPPAVQAVSLSVVNALLAQMRAYTASTPDKLDDAIEAVIESKVNDLVAQLKAGTLQSVN